MVRDAAGEFSIVRVSLNGSQLGGGNARPARRARALASLGALSAALAALAVPAAGGRRA